MGLWPSQAARCMLRSPPARWDPPAQQLETIQPQSIQLGTHGNWPINSTSDRTRPKPPRPARSANHPLKSYALPKEKLREPSLFPNCNPLFSPSYSCARRVPGDFQSRARFSLISRLRLRRRRWVRWESGVEAGTVRYVYMLALVIDLVV